MTDCTAYLPCMFYIQKTCLNEKNWQVEGVFIQYYRVVHKKTGDFSRQPQIASGQIIYQNVGNFLEIMCAKFGGIRCYRRLAVPEKLPKIGPKSRFTSGL